YFTLCVLFLMTPAPTDTYTLSLHDALPISLRVHHRRRRDAARHVDRRHQHSGDRLQRRRRSCRPCLDERGLGADGQHPAAALPRSEEHTSELQSRENLVCRLLLEKKKKRNK